MPIKICGAALLAMAGCVVQAAVTTDLTDIPSLQAVGQEPPAMAAITGPRMLRVPLPDTGRALHLSVTRVAIAMRDWQVYVTDLVPAQSRTIRLGRLMAGE